MHVVIKRQFLNTFICSKTEGLLKVQAVKYTAKAVICPKRCKMETLLLQRPLIGSGIRPSCRF